MREKRIIYLAYGSNLNIAQMAHRCPDARPWGTTLLRGYRLTFWGADNHAYATIVPAQGETVPVALWSVNAKDELSLDRYEGFPHLYRKEFVKVPWGKRTVSAMVYIMNRGKVGFPSKFYFETVFEGYDDFKLDPEPLFQALWDAQKAHLKR
ncbi:MAG: gamma-glutamylcyclotransferase, partial [Oscillospiraceae bacterium]|nr:gamma-glutamylcyclotransferase [Oscillospiraceae bacterium]